MWGLRGLLELLWHCNNYISGCFYLIRVFTRLEFLHGRFIGELEYIADYFGSNYVDVLESRHHPFNSKLALMTYISNFLIRPVELRGTGGMCPLFFCSQNLRTLRRHCLLCQKKSASGSSESKTIAKFV